MRPKPRRFSRPSPRGAVRVQSVDEPTEVVLRETGDLLELLAGNLVLLSSAALGTERSFGELATLCRGTPRRVIVGGLGFGMTARGVLDVAAASTRVVVVEKVDAVIDLVKGKLAHMADRPLDDPRIELVRGDVGEVIAQRNGDVDAILLDVDNGPHWASFRTNARLYSLAGLADCKRALAPGGVLAVWSGYRADAFLSHLRKGGFAPSVVPLQERGRVRARAYVGRI